MAESILGLLLFIGILAVVALIFGGWVIGNIARGIGRALGLFQDRPKFAPPPYAALPPRTSAMLRDGAPGFLQCPVPGCRHVNPTDASYCRHCGHAFTAAV